MNKIYELEIEIKELKNEAEGLKNEGKVDEALAIVNNIKARKSEIEKLKEIEAELIGEIENKGDDKKMENKKEEVSLIHAFTKMVMGNKVLTDAEQEALKGASVKNAVTGEEHVQIKELSTRVVELLRENRSILKQYCTIHKTAAISGQFPVLKMEDKLLVDVVDGVDMTNDDSGLGFELIKFALGKKGRLFLINDTILKFSAADLLNYIARLFVDCYVRTINKAILDSVLLKANGTDKKDHKVVTGVEDVVDATMLDLDQALVEGSALYMNRVTFNKLAKDKNAENGLRYIQTDLTKPAVPFINGLPVRLVAKELEAYENTAGDKNIYPILLANLSEAVMVFENEEYEIGFQKNFRANCVDNKVICYFDVKEVDSEAYSILALEETI